MTESDELTKIIQNARASGDARVQRTIDLIVSVCKEQENRNSTDFSVATIGRLCADNGGINAQSIRNEKQGRYKAIIRSFQKKNAKRSVRPTQNNEHWISRITDSNAQWLARDLEGQLRAAQDELRILKQIERTIYVTPSTSDPKPSELSETHKRAIKHFTSNEHLTKLAFSVSDEGELIDSEGKIISKVGFIHALKMIIT